MMTRWIAALFVCLSLLPAALADEEIRVEDGRVSGQLTADNGTVITLDMPVPENPFPAEMLTVEYRRITKKEMQQALRAIGQSDEGSFADGVDGCYTGDWNAEASADISREEAAAQAVSIGLAYFDALGIDVARVPRYVSRPYEFECRLGLMSYPHTVSEADAYIEYERALFDSPRRRRTRPKQSAYTCVSFCVLLNGMYLDEVPSYPAGYADEPDARIGFSVTATVTVSDSGILVDASAGSIPVVKAITPCDPLPDWQDDLEQLCRDWGSLPFSYEEHTLYNEHIQKEVTVYAQRPVLVGLYPCLTTIAEDTWVPVWKSICTGEVLRDGYRLPCWTPWDGLTDFPLLPDENNAQETGL